MKYFLLIVSIITVSCVNKGTINYFNDNEKLELVQISYDECDEEILIQHNTVFLNTGEKLYDEIEGWVMVNDTGWESRLNFNNYGNCYVTIKQNGFIMNLYEKTIKLMVLSDNERMTYYKENNWDLLDKSWRVINKCDGNVPDSTFDKN